MTAGAEQQVANLITFACKCNHVRVRQVVSTPTVSHKTETGNRNDVK